MANPHDRNGLFGARSASSGSPESASDLRAVYRVAEARSARLRLLFDSARDLATAEDDAVDQQLQLASQRAAHFLGFARGRLAMEQPANVSPDARVIDLAPASGVGPVAYLVLDNLAGGAVHPDDLEAVGVLGQLMMARLASMHRERERDLLLSEIAEREARLATLVERLIVDDEHARRRLAADLHDGVAQVAGAALRRLEIIDEIRPQLSPDTLSEIDRGVELVRQTVGELRSLIRGLRPVTLESLGLAAALSEELPRLIDVPLHVRTTDAAASRPSPEVEISLFRAAQEAVHNIRKHARGCTRVEVRLDMKPSGLRLEIVNDGDEVDQLKLQSRPTGSPASGLGLLMMRERISAIGGDLRIDAVPGGGVRLEIGLCYRPATSQQ
jgi:two-component system, NarL family, sensor kinase